MKVEWLNDEKTEVKLSNVIDKDKEEHIHIKGPKHKLESLVKRVEGQYDPKETFELVKAYQQSAGDKTPVIDEKIHKVK